jgi:hypothetical protein
MNSAKLASALQQCVKLCATLGGVYTLHHAVNLARLMQASSFAGTGDEVGTDMAQLIGVQIITKPERFDSRLTHPSRGSTLKHLRWALGELGPLTFHERCHQCGFVAGAAARIHLVGSYFSKELIDARDEPWLIDLAESSGSVQHHLAHFVLGYLQGWLWANGQGSIDYYRRMLEPDDKPVEPAA